MGEMLGKLRPFLDCQLAGRRQCAEFLKLLMGILWQHPSSLPGAIVYYFTHIDRSFRVERICASFPIRDSNDF